MVEKTPNIVGCKWIFKDKYIFYLQELNTLQHPVIILPGVEYTNLCALVTFMYNGEVNIYQEQLPALLAMADTLHVRGLADIAGVNFLFFQYNFFFLLTNFFNIIWL